MRYIALLFAASLFAQSEVIVHIYNPAGVPVAEVSQALKIANRVFAPAGIAVRWQHCPEACPEAVPDDVLIVGLAGPQLDMPTPTAMGFAMMPAGKGNRAAVSVPRVERFAEASNVPATTVLAYSIVHELGHLITRSKRHSAGVMMAQWSRADALRMGLSRLTFTPEDVQTMQRALKAFATNRPIAE